MVHLIELIDSSLVKRRGAKRRTGPDMYDTLSLPDIYCSDEVGF